jgi:hypothetical protein
VGNSCCSCFVHYTEFKTQETADYRHSSHVVEDKAIQEFYLQLSSRTFVGRTAIEFCTWMKKMILNGSTVLVSIFSPHFTQFFLQVPIVGVLTLSGEAPAGCIL